MYFKKVTVSEFFKSAAQNSPEHMKLQQQLKLLGQQVQAAAAANKTTPQVSAQQLKQLAGKHQLVSLQFLRFYQIIYPSSLYLFLLFFTFREFFSDKVS